MIAAGPSVCRRSPLNYFPAGESGAGKPTSLAGGSVCVLHQCWITFCHACCGRPTTPLRDHSGPSCWQPVWPVVAQPRILEELANASSHRECPRGVRCSNRWCRAHPTLRSSGSCRRNGLRLRVERCALVRCLKFEPTKSMRRAPSSSASSASVLSSFPAARACATSVMARSACRRIRCHRQQFRSDLLALGRERIDPEVRSCASSRPAFFSIACAAIISCCA